jgi:outer membrane biosynthesis protein TonB
MKLVVRRTPVATPGMWDGGGLHGVVTAEVCIDREGKVVGIKMLKGHPMAYQSVLESVREWKFAAYKLNGRAMPVTGNLDVPFDFGRPAPTSPVSH